MAVLNKTIHGMEREDRLQSIKEGVENDEMEATDILHSLGNSNSE